MAKNPYNADMQSTGQNTGSRGKRYNNVYPVNPLPLGASLLRTRLTQVVDTGEVVAVHEYAYKGAVLRVQETVRPFAFKGSQGSHGEVVALQKIRATPLQPRPVNKQYDNTTGPNQVSRMIRGFLGR